MNRPLEPCERGVRVLTSASRNARADRSCVVITDGSARIAQGGEDGLPRLKVQLAEAFAGQMDLERGARIVC